MNIREPVHFLRKSLRWSKLWNVAQALSSYGLSRIVRRPIIWGMPPVLMVEPTNVCNLHCPLCPSGNGTLRRKRGYMDFDLFRRAIDEISGKSLMVLLWNQGESFLHRDFLRMVRYASEHGLYTLASTNGHYLNSPEEIVRSGLDSLIISLDGATPETYTRYRVGGDFDRVIHGIRQLAATKRRLRSKLPIIHVQFILFRHNLHELEKIRELAASLGADKVTYKTAQVYDGKEAEDFLPREPRFRRYQSVNGEVVSKAAARGSIPNRCRTLWVQPVLNWDGTVTPCCFDKHGDFAVGYLSEETTLRRIWHGELMNAFRRRVMTDRGALAMCRNCTEGIKTNYREEDIRIV
ncbi:MAG TPA: radical SAM protein [Candidatus Latescibacteria bacterium]|nr:radical SAM protein [Candidatus Latescibacterota bacterium]